MTNAGHRLRIAFLAGSRRSFSGMIIAAILEEAVEPVGIVWDLGKPEPKVIRSAFASAAGGAPPLPTPPREAPLSEWKAWYIRARLAMVMPAHYVSSALSRLGMPWPDTYERLNRKDSKRYPMLDELAERQGLPLHRVDCVNSPEAERLLRDMGADLVVGLATRIIEPNILKIPRLGILNAHSSLLPEYRGTATEFWQLAHGETTTGVTVHWMDARVDEGAIIAQDEWPIEPGASHHELRLLSQLKRRETWRRAVRAVIAGERGRPQGRARTPKFRRPTLQDQYDLYVRRQIRRLACDPEREGASRATVRRPGWRPRRDQASR